ncbi:hypothetical protein [Pseudomonas sp. EMN2]|uniref:hypothetical protein n=1 Tax=Pseudomonas sp. EMN2 TaxID=2615212 RepID=UPI00129AD7A7|nr:hypothetical protein [Pseudomonas sp. EMN2]
MTAATPLTDPVTITLSGIDLAALNAYRAARLAYARRDLSSAEAKQAKAELQQAEKNLATSVHVLTRQAIA